MTGSPPPRRRHSPSVYRRRRLVVLIGIVVVVAVVWLLIAQPWRGAATEGETTSAPPAESLSPQATATDLPVPDAAPATPAATPVSTAGPSPSASPSATSGAVDPAVAPCTAGDLSVEPLTDQTTYAASAKPKLSIALTNTSDRDCTLNVGTSTQKFVITSGSDTWWRSTDCQSTPSDQVVLLAAGQRVTSATPLMWDRTRSAVKTCTTSSRPKAPGGGASYHLSVQIGGVASDDSAQFLLY